MFTSLYCHTVSGEAWRYGLFPFEQTAHFFKSHESSPSLASFFNATNFLYRTSTATIASGCPTSSSAITFSLFQHDQQFKETSLRAAYIAFSMLLLLTAFCNTLFQTDSSSRRCLLKEAGSVLFPYKSICFSMLSATFFSFFIVTI
jgi:hypothetical protein